MGARCGGDYARLSATFLLERLPAAIAELVAEAGCGRPIVPSSHAHVLLQARVEQSVGHIDILLWPSAGKPLVAPGPCWST